MADDEMLTWYKLLERRHSLRERGPLTDQERGETFSAALAQFEEMFKAASAVTEYTRPLLLYYGLAQAGLAIAAACSPDPWTFNNHGLKLGNRTAQLSEMTISPQGDGGFQRVAATIDSPAIAVPVSIGEAWAALPNLSEGGMLPGSEYACPLRLVVEWGASPHGQLFVPGSPPVAGEELTNEVNRIKRAYPTAGDWALPADGNPVLKPAAAGERWALRVRWPDAGELDPADLQAFYDKTAPAYRYQAERYLWPSMAGGAPLSPLMTWWILLFACSILARYQPRQWGKMLDPGASDIAALLRFMLDEALGSVPQLVLGALDGHPVISAGSIR